MTTIKDPIRLASLFTMNGLIDPRLMPEYLENKIESRVLKKSKTSALTFRGVLENIWRRKLGYQ